eukprot:m.288615 g.288615  ORF g.288615 m.288615 type:complete len:470 (+) comp55048_c0_seq3:116-1525(+)
MFGDQFPDFSFWHSPVCVIHPLIDCSFFSLPFECIQVWHLRTDLRLSWFFSHQVAYSVFEKNLVALVNARTEKVCSIKLKNPYRVSLAHGMVAVAHEEGVTVLTMLASVVVAFKCLSPAIAVRFFHSLVLVASGHKDGSIKIHDVNRKVQLTDITAHTDWVWDLCIANNDQVLFAACEDCTISVHTFDLAALMSGPSVPPSPPTSRAPTLGFSRSTSAASMKPRASTHTYLKGHVECVQAAILLGDQETLVSGSDDNTLRVWNVSTGECERVLTQHIDTVRCLAVHDDGKMFASGSDDYTVILWDGLLMEVKLVIECGNYIHSIAFDSEHDFVVCGVSGKGAFLYEIGDGNQVTCYSRQGKGKRPYAFVFGVDHAPNPGSKRTSVLVDPLPKFATMQSIPKPFPKTKSKESLVQASSENLTSLDPPTDELSKTPIQAESDAEQAEDMPAADEPEPETYIARTNVLRRSF